LFFTDDFSTFITPTNGQIKLHALIDRSILELYVNDGEREALKDNGIFVISMQDLLGWRKAEKAIPSKSAVITIDDEWNRLSWRRRTTAVL